MQNWEYNVLNTRLSNSHPFDELGKDGWELISVIRDPEDGKYVYAYFKRPKG
jgi:hypothetical protein